MMPDDPRHVTAPACELITAGRVYAVAGPVRRIVGARLFWAKEPRDAASGIAVQALIRSSQPDRLESAGVTLTGGSVATASYVDLRGPRDALRRALREFTEALPNAAISPEAFEAARAAAVHQAERRAHEPKSVAAEHFRYVRAGLSEDDPATVRLEDLPALGSRPAHLLIVGDDLDSYVDTVPATADGPLPRAKLNPDPPAVSEVKSGSGAQAYVLWGGAAAIAGAADHVVLELTMHLLGGWSGARWHALFREQLGYTYGTTAASASLRFASLTAGLAYVGMSVAADALAKTESLLLDQAKAFLDHGPGAAELTLAAVQLLRTEAHYSDSTRNLMARTASYLQAGLGPRFAAERMAALREAEPERFLSRMRELLRDRTLVTVTA